MPARNAVLYLLGAAFLAVQAVPAAAQDAQVPPSKEEVELTPEEIAERESRKACKVAICDAFHNRKPGNDISCHVVKSWRKEHLQKIVSKAKVSWPWGRVRCSTDIKLRRETLIKAMTEPKHEAFSTLTRSLAKSSARRGMPSSSLPSHRRCFSRMARP